MIIKKMNGHSGCHIYLQEEAGKKFIRKISASQEYNSRLLKQMEKQQLFNHSDFYTPTVYKSGYTNNLFYFDMEFIRGAPMHNYVSLNSINNIMPIFDKIYNYLQEKVDNTKDITPLINKKLSSLIPRLPSYTNKYYNYCREHDWSKTPVSQNHGDLTFENILIYRNKIYFIDFLDSFIQTKYVDYSKIMQDVVLDWSWRHNMDKPLIKTIHLYDKMLQEMSFEEIEASKRLLVLNLLRIIPYSNGTTLKYLQNRLQYLGKIFGIP